MPGNKQLLILTKFLAQKRFMGGQWVNDIIGKIIYELVKVTCMINCLPV